MFVLDFLWLALSKLKTSFHSLGKIGRGKSFSDTHMLISHLMKSAIMKIAISFYVTKLKWTQNKIL